MEVWSDFFAYNGPLPTSSRRPRPACRRPAITASASSVTTTARRGWIVKNSWGTTWATPASAGSATARRTCSSTPAGCSTRSTCRSDRFYQSTTVSQVYASRDAQNAWAYFPSLGWRRIQPGSADGVTNLLAVLSEAVAKNLTITALVDGTFVYQAYL
jgi:hypothetical protein